MGRPKLSPEQRRDVQTTVLYTIEERAELERRARALGLSLSEYIRRRTLGVPLPPQSADREARDKLATSLLRIGVNLNQMTKHMNAGKPVPHSLPALLDHVRLHLNRLDHESSGDHAG